jgi:hypothetical protein
VREVADEADGVGQHDRCGPGDVYPAQRGVERGEELIGRVSIGAGQAVEECDLPAFV